MVKRLLSLLAAFALLLGCGGGIDFALGLTADAAPEQVEFAVDKGKLQVQVYADDIIRVRFAPDGTFRDKGQATFVDSSVKWEAVDYTVDETDADYTITTAKLVVKVEKETGRVSYFDKDGNAVAAENTRRAQTVALDGKTYYTVTQAFDAAETEYLYGLGNVDTVVGIRGQTVNIAQANTEKRTPMFYSNQGYGVLFDITSNGTLSWGSGNSTYSYRGNATDSIDYYFFYGPDADEVISGYRQVTGTATMLPKNTFGYVQSRNRYPNQRELLANVQKFRDKGIPLDVTVIDYYWWQGGFNNITQWNTGDWTNVSQMMDELHEQHVTASISVWPSFQAGTPTYNLVSQKDGFLISENTQQTQQFGEVYDPTSAENRSYYWNLIYSNVFSKGLDSIWLDACEPEMGNWAKTGVATSIGNSRVIGALYPLLTNQGVYEGQRALEGNEKRVNTLTRGAVAGIQRYGTQSWSGDVASTWAQLTKEVRGALNYAAAGLPYFSTDTGGYFGIDTGSEENREMFLRWLQFSTFSSIMRVHGEGCIKEPWSFGAEYEEYIVSYINLRERLVPYIYSLVGAVTQDDYTIVRPLVFDFRTDENVWTIDDQYMFGDYFMVCPVTELGVRTREVYLPAGQWTNFWTGEILVSEGETFTVAAALDEIPVFVKAGAVVPMAMESEWVDQHPDENEIRVYMGADGAFTLYEDEGNNYNYEEGAFTEIPLTYDEETRTLTIGKRTGSYEGMPETREFHVVFVEGDYGNGVPSSIKYDTTVTYTGEAATVTYNPDFEPPVPPLKLSTLPKPGSAPQPQAPARAMVGEWLFGEGEGAKVRDTSGNYNNGAIKNTATANWGAGVADNALTFSGGTAASGGTYVDVADTATLDLTDSISFSAWVNFTGSGHANILNKGGNGNKNPGFSFIILNGNMLQLEIQDQNGNKTSAQATGGFPRNGWHHVAFTWQSEETGGDGIVRIYLDGKQTSLDSNAANKFTGPIGTNEYPLRFGCSADNEPDWPNYFKGSIDEARLYNYKLTAAEIASLANKETIGVPNPDDITVAVKDGGLDITWTDPAVDNLESVTVTVESENRRYNKSFTVAAGTQKQEITGLTNGNYYYVSLQTVLADGSTSQGAYLVSGVNTHPAEITCVVTHDQTVYGYVVNYSGTELTGTLTAQVRSAADGSLINAVVATDFVAGALDAQRFQLDIGEYADGQLVKILFTQEATELAAPVTTLREERYAYDADAATLRAVLRELCNTAIDESPYTAESVTAYYALTEQALALCDKTDATVTELSDMIQAMKTTLVLKPDERDPLWAELKELCDAKIDESLYTAESVSAYYTLRDRLAALCDDPNATVEQLTGAITQLKSTLVEKPDGLLGDVNGDGEVNTTDARLVLQYAVNKIDADALDLTVADVNRDGEVNTTDARLILQKAVGKIEDFE